MTWLAAFLALPLWLPPVHGALNPAVTQATIHDTICVPGWSATQRPPMSYTEPLKWAAVRKLPDKHLSHYQWDHLIGIDLGGSPTDRANMWAEPLHGRCGALVKDRLDRLLPRLVCAGKLSLAEAQHEIVSDWVASYNRHIAPLTCE